MKTSGSFKSVLLAAWLCIFVTSHVSAGGDSGTLLKVFTRDDGNLSHFYIQNLQPGAVTTTFEMRLVNMQGSIKFPCTATLAGNDTIEVFALSPIQTNKPWHFSFVRSSTIGSADAQPDGFIYSLPYAPGSSFDVCQGYHGKFSHSGPDEYSIDWRMPVGTPVHAARGGLVIKSKDDEDRGGPDRKYENSANYILIQHDDGTIGIYGHLKHGGSLVRVGGRVRTGDLIALSGNTGFTSGPHLHFSVFKTTDGKTRLSLPVKFRSEDRGVVTPVSGEHYTAEPPDEHAEDDRRFASNAGTMPAATP